MGAEIMGHEAAEAAGDEDVLNGIYQFEPMPKRHLDDHEREAAGRTFDKRRPRPMALAAPLVHEAVAGPPEPADAIEAIEVATVLPRALAGDAEAVPGFMDYMLSGGAEPVGRLAA